MAGVGFIGTGVIAAHMVRALAADGHKLVVSKRSASTSAALAGEFDNVTVADNQQILDGAETVFLCLMADVCRVLLPGLSFRAGQTVISVMVDVGLDELHGLCAPATNIAITIPLPFIETGGCPLPVYPRCAALENLFGARNPVISLSSEAAMAPHFAATGTVSPILELLNTTSAWLGDLSGDHRAAETYVASLFGGYLGAINTDGESRFTEELRNLSTDGGLNATLRSHMARGGAPRLLLEGLDGLRERLGLPPRHS